MSSGIGIARRRSGLSASRRTKARVSRPSQISVSPRVTRCVLDEDLGAPLLDVGRDRELLGVGRGGDELGRDLEQRRADDAARLHQLAPRRHAALHEERQRRGVHPALEVGIEDDAGGVAVAELRSSRGSASSCGMAVGSGCDAARSRRGRVPRYRRSTSASRWVSTARWLIEPLSVISPRSIDGGSASTSARATRVALPVPLA